MFFLWKPAAPSLRDPNSIRVINLKDRESTPYFKNTVHSVTHGLRTPNKAFFHSNIYVESAMPILFFILCLQKQQQIFIGTQFVMTKLMACKRHKKSSEQILN